MKKIIAGLTAVFMMFGSGYVNPVFRILNQNTITAGAESSAAGFEFDSETGTIKRYNGRESDLVIPSEINGVLVKNIGDGAFWKCYFNSVIIPEGVVNIGGGAFEECYDLTSVTIPDSVTSIGEEAFSRCYSLTSVTIPDSVTSIGNSAFEECSSLTSVRLSDSMTHIGEGVFNWCESLTSINIPDGVESIGRN